MPNHYHLLVRQKIDGGIVRFMQKLGTGYTNYFNKKYERSGSLFQGNFKAVRIKNDAHFLYVPYYIHCNPLDLFQQNWKEDGIKDIKGAIKFIENYKWSSFLDYIDKKNFPLVIQKNFLSTSIANPRDYKKAMAEWISETLNIDEISNVILE